MLFRSLSDTSIKDGTSGYPTTEDSATPGTPCAARSRRSRDAIGRLGQAHADIQFCQRTRDRRPVDCVSTLESTTPCVAHCRWQVGDIGCCIECRRASTTHRRDRRIRIGPFARLGSTTRPPWVICTSPLATRRRAAIRAGSISDCHETPPT